MAIIKNIIGKQFTRLLVIKQLEQRGNKGQIKYECLCDCGKGHTTSGESIRSGKSKSCGCLKREHLDKQKYRANSDRKEQLIRYLYKGSRLKRKSCNLSIDDFTKLILSPCAYCGTEHSNYSKDIRNGKEITDTILYYNGLDRIDSNQGYNTGNVVSCCKNCNVAKASMTKDDFMSWIKRVYTFNFELLAKTPTGTTYLSRRMSDIAISSVKD